MRKQQITSNKKNAILWFACAVLYFIGVGFLLNHMHNNMLESIKNAQALPGEPPVDPRILIKEIEEKGLPENVAKKEELNYQYVDYRDVSVRMKHERVVKDGKPRIKWTYLASGNVKRGAQTIASFHEVELIEHYTDDTKQNDKPKE